jgi:hypothetical protein
MSAFLLDQTLVRRFCKRIELRIQACHFSGVE